MRHTRGLRLVLARGACWWFENIIDRCLLWLWLISIVYEMVNILMCQIRRAMRYWVHFQVINRLNPVSL